MKNLFTPAICKTLVILGIASLTALPVLAQEGKWAVDAEHSTASIFLGNNSDLQSVGIARVGGNAELNSAEPKSALDLSAKLPQGQAMRFKSKRIDLRADGKLQITGEMTLARTEYDATYNPGEDYYGPVYGEPVVRTVTREVTFVVPPADNARGKAEITAEATLGVENFPELFAVVREAAWQPVVQDEACEIPQAGEDYRGANCTGTLIAPVYRVSETRIGEDYRGDESPAPSGNLMKLVLRLQLSRENLG